MLALILALAMDAASDLPPETATQKVERLTRELHDAKTAARLERAARAVNDGMKRKARR